jgi:hypothetical protein
MHNFELIIHFWANNKASIWSQFYELWYILKNSFINENRVQSTLREWQMRILCKISHICIKISNNETEEKLNYIKFEIIPHS